MKISETKKTALYGALHDAAMDLRVRMKMNPEITLEEMDEKIYNLVNDQWDNTKEVLNFSD